MKVPRPGRYILRCMAGGYHTAFYPVEAQYTASKTTFDAGDFYLQEMSTQIAEAVVTGTKIRMFYKGDTLVYNASAFQLPEGSMLNDLVKQLPGAELRDGNIYINGRLVENMLIGGKNFFNGDPMAALANLPAYVINSVKAYEKRGEKSETTGTSMGDEQFVMDVHLKRKYIGTYLGQLVGGYGTDDRYQAGLFLMRFDDRQSFNIMGDFNNRNQNNVYSRQGENGRNDNSGKHRRNYLSLNYQYEPHGRLRFTAGGTYHDNAVHERGGSSRENYLAGGNTFGRTATSSYADDLSLSANTCLTLRPKTGRFMELKYGVNYVKSNGHSSERTANYDALPPSAYSFEALIDRTFSQALTDPLLHASVLSRLRNEVSTDGKRLQMNASARLSQAFNGNLLNVHADYTADNRRDNRYDLYHLNYTRPDDRTDFRHRYQREKTDNGQWLAEASYDWKYRQTEHSEGQLTPSYSFRHERCENDRPLYRLDLLGGEWASYDAAMLRMLPSAREEMVRVMSQADSYWSELRSTFHTLGFNWRHDLMLANRRWLRMNATAQMTLQSASQDYLRYGANHPVERTSWLPAPSFTIYYHPLADDRRGMRSRWMLRLSSREEQVALLHLVDLTDAADPLNVHQGNPGLHNPWVHRGELSYVRSFKKRAGQVVNMLTFELREHEVAMSSTYDRSTGVRTTRPVNVDGNWALRYMFYSFLPLDEKQRWIISPMASVDYRRSADLSWTADAAGSMDSRVNTFTLSGGCNLQCRPTAWLNFGGMLKAEWNRLTGSRAAFQTISATNLLAALQAELTLPASLLLHADCNLNSRFGYNDASLNDTRLMLNASLERPIRSFTLKLQACDLLARNRYTTSVIDAQGRTETFANCLPRYFLFSLSWKFNRVANRR